MNLPAEVEQTAMKYLAIIDERLPNRITGCYLVGSIALNDYIQGNSDLDFVSVCNSPLRDDELRQIESAHQDFHRDNTPKLDGVYVTWQDLQSKPDGTRLPYFLGGNFENCHAFAANPVTWFILDRYPISLRGPEQPKVYNREQELIVWCKNNLAGYWMRWIQNARRRLPRMLAPLPPDDLAWGVLGVARIHATIKTTDIISKSAAGAYAIDAFDCRWESVIHDALAYHTGNNAARCINPLRRRNATVSFMEAVIADAFEL